jgi:acetyl-CoA carboxylase, biotin carboxylase subunit
VVQYLRVPSGPGVRWDGGFEAGNEITLYYDPLIAKLIVWGETRAVALERMRRALRELVIVGIPSSQVFHLRVMDDPGFQRGEFDVTYLERAGARLLAEPLRPELTRPLAVVAALMAEEQRVAAARADAERPATGPSPWLVAARREAVRE